VKHGRTGTESHRHLLDLLRSLGARFTPDQAGALLGFESLLRDRAVPLGLIARSDADRLLERHVLDCVRAVPALLTTDREIADVGSGAGLPGIPVAILRPDAHVSLVEPRRRAVAFLELAVERLGLENVEVIAGRAERLERAFDVCLARAFGPLERTWQVVAPLLGPGGRLVYFAGREFRLPEPPPEAVSLRMVVPPLLESGGPLVIMSRQ